MALEKYIIAIAVTVVETMPLTLTYRVYDFETPRGLHAGYNYVCVYGRANGLLAFTSGVNVTVGLPFVRTSPDHGTAYDIAGRGVADPESMVEAIKAALSLKPA